MLKLHVVMSTNIVQSIEDSNLTKSTMLCNAKNKFVKSITTILQILNILVFATSTYLCFENYYSRHKNTDKTLYEQEHSEHIFPGDFLYISYNIINTT